MQTANALNNIIRILFNPKIEDFKLFDFLVVKSNENRYLAQITEIYDDKFDASQNVAKLKIFYKISKNNEVMPYDNFTPNKECEIVKIKQEEIEDFINIDKETFVFATNAKSQTALNIQYEFFNNNPVILADKIECANTISLNIAKKLSEKKHAIIIDSTGVIEHDCARKITANKDIKIPLNYSTIDFVFDRCLDNASLEFQATAGPIINEIKNFAKKQVHEYIPFNAFLRVILEQYKATPYPELKVLIMRMKKFQMDEIFARYKKDVENLHKAIEKNAVTIIDISAVDTFWQKVYLEYLSDEINEDVYLITRINDENCDTDLINKIYNKRKNIGFIPAVSYNYKKLPSVMQYCKNYILLPSLYQRNDFLDANFALSNLIPDGCIIFGENTDNFLYLAKDYELAVQEKRKNYKKIALSLIDKDEQEDLADENLGNKGDYFENQQKTDSQKLISELSVLEKENNKKIEEKSPANEEFVELQNPTEQDKVDEFEEIVAKEENTAQDEPDNLQSVQEPAGDIAEDNNDNSEEIKIDSLPDIKEDNETNDDKAVPEAENELVIEEDNKINFDDDLVKTEQSEVKEEIIKQESEEKDTFSLEELAVETPESKQEEPKEEEKKQEQKQETDTNSGDVINFSDEELDFFQMAQDDEVQTDVSKSDTLDLSEVADTSVDTSFENIINTEAEAEKQTLNLDNDTTIDEDALQDDAKDDSLPIFKEEIKENSSDEYIYSVGDKVSHGTYGVGTVVKILKYEGRQLLQINFEEAGKKTLEPRIANVKPVK